MDKKNILFTSVGNLAFPTAAECLKKTFPDCKIVGVDVRKNAHGLYFCDKKYLVDYRNSPNFMTQIFDICKREEINVIWPLSTEDQNYFSERKHIFEKENIKVVCSDFNAVNIVNNKYKLYIMLRRFNINVPVFYPVRDISRIENIISKVGGPENPFVIKPFVGKGGSNLYIVGTNSSLLRKDDLKFFKEYSDFIAHIEKYIVPNNTMICEYLSGNEYSVDILSKNGKIYYGIVRKRYSSYGGLALEAEVVKNDEILTLAKNAVGRFRLSYINNIQIKEDMSGSPKIMEINPRIPGTLSLSIKAGPDFISDTIRLLNDEEVMPPTKIKYGMKIIRYWTGVFINKEDTNSIEDLR